MNHENQPPRSTSQPAVASRRASASCTSFFTSRGTEKCKVKHLQNASQPSPRASSRAGAPRNFRICKIQNQPASRPPRRASRGTEKCCCKKFRICEINLKNLQNHDHVSTTATSQPASQPASRPPRRASASSRAGGKNQNLQITRPDVLPRRASGGFFTGAPRNVAKNLKNLQNMMNHDNVSNTARPASQPASRPASHSQPASRPPSRHASASSRAGRNVVANNFGKNLQSAKS